MAVIYVVEDDANIQEIEINKLYKPKVTISPEHLDEIKENKSRAMAIDTINNEFFQGVMSPSWYSDIDLWFKKYGFSVFKNSVVENKIFKV